jgi:fructose-specific phosphotransferase system component IIB
VIILINLNTNNPAGGMMEGISEQEINTMGKTETIEEFEGYFNDNPELYELRNDIRGMLYRTLIPSYECTLTEDDVIGELKFIIYAGKNEWDKARYPEFKQFLISNAQNIIKAESDLLKTQYGMNKSKKKKKAKEEQGENSGDNTQRNTEGTDDDNQANAMEQEENSEVRDEKSDEVIQANSEKVGENRFKDGMTLYTAKPRNRFYGLEHYKENDIDEVEKDHTGKKENKVFDMRSFVERNDLSKFEGTVAVILQSEKDSKLLAIFNGHMDEKRPCVVMKECNMSKREYNNARRRLLYRLRQELPPQYKSMIVGSILAHLIIRCLFRMNGYIH